MRKTYQLQPRIAASLPIPTHSMLSAKEVLHELVVLSAAGVPFECVRVVATTHEADEQHTEHINADVFFSDHSPKIEDICD